MRDAGDGSGGWWLVVVVVECLREWTHEKLNGAGKAKVGQSLIVWRISNQSADERAPRVYRQYFRLRTQWLSADFFFSDIIR